MLRTARRLLHRLKRDHAGAVGVVAAFALPAMLAMSSLVAEYGHALVVKTQDQNVADAAAYAGAIAYNSTASQGSMTAAAQQVGALNGVLATGVTATLVNSPTGDGNQAVQVQVSTDVPLFLAQVFGAKASMPVSATSYAELSAQANPCVIALKNNGAGVTLSGGTSVTASKCSIGSNASLTVPCGTTITAVSVSYNGAAPSQKCGGIQSPSGGAAPIFKRSSVDPLAGSPAVKALSDQVTADLGLHAPAGPSVPTGQDVDFNGQVADVQAALASAHCNGTPSGSAWTVTCMSGVSHNFGKVSISGSTTVNFALSSPATDVYTFSGEVSVSGGGQLTTGNGSFQLAQGLSTSGNTTVKFGSGAFSLGVASCGYSICDSGASVSFGGPSNFVLAAGATVGGGSALTMGSGAANTFQVGPYTKTGDAFDISGGGSLFLGDATGSATSFQVVGNISSNGGTCVSIGAATNHDINGSIDMSGAVTLGSGLYTVTGYVALGGNNGGNVTCNRTSTGLEGTNVVLSIGGQPTYPNGNCAGLALCIGAGYQTVTLTAPTTGPYAGLVVVGPQTNNAGALFTAGASNTSISGVFYFPTGPIGLTGGANLGGGAGQCLEIIGSELTLGGGTTAASNCISSTSSQTASITLVQ